VLAVKAGREAFQRRRQCQAPQDRVRPRSHRAPDCAVPRTAGGPEPALPSAVPKEARSAIVWTRSGLRARSRRESRREPGRIAREG
jgi:hypothetical protein